MGMIMKTLNAESLAWFFLSLSVAEAANESPSRWTRYNGYYYGLYNFQEMTWDDARRYCQRYGADLASITCEAERQFAWKLAGMKTTWIGGSDQASEGTFTWSDGTPWVNSLWSQGEPNNYAGDQDCVTMWQKKNG